MEQTEIDAELLRELDGRARIAEKRALIELIDEVVVESTRDGPAPRRREPEPRPMQTQQAPLAIPFLDAATLAALSPALSMLSSVSSTPSGPILVPATNEEIHQPRPSLYKKLYSDIPLQCKACAFRFPDTASGKARMEAHLDEHFRRNMRQKEVTKKVLTRDWFAPEDEWIVGAERVAAERQASMFQEEANDADLEGAEENVPNLAIGDDHSPRTCEVCQEAMELFWDDDADAWMLKNAVMVDGIIVHANCKNK